MIKNLSALIPHTYRDRTSAPWRPTWCTAERNKVSGNHAMLPCRWTLYQSWYRDMEYRIFTVQGYQLQCMHGYLLKPDYSPFCPSDPMGMQLYQPLQSCFPVPVILWPYGHAAIYYSLSTFAVMFPCTSDPMGMQLFYSLSTFAVMFPCTSDPMGMQLYYSLSTFAVMFPCTSASTESSSRSFSVKSCENNGYRQPPETGSCTTNSTRIPLSTNLTAELN